MIQHIKDAEYSRMANKNNIHVATGGSNVYLLRYTNDSLRMPILWVETNGGAITERLESNIASEKCNIYTTDLSKYVLVHFREIKGKHDNGRYVDPSRIPGVMQEYKQELARGSIPVLNRIKDNV